MMLSLKLEISSNVTMSILAACYVICLFLSCNSVPGMTKQDDIVMWVFDWSFPLPDLAQGSIINILFFGLISLDLSIVRPGSVVALESEVVKVEVDDCT